IAADPAEIARIEGCFSPPPYEPCPGADTILQRHKDQNADFARFIDVNTTEHKQPGHTIVTVSLKPIGGVPGDAASAQMLALADAADRFSFGELRVSHEQNIVLPHVRKDALYDLWTALCAVDLATANRGLVSDIIACPGLDYCA